MRGGACARKEQPDGQYSTQIQKCHAEWIDLAQQLKSAAEDDLDVWPAWVGEDDVPELNVGSLRASPGPGLPCRHHLRLPIQQGKHPGACAHGLHHSKQSYSLYPVPSQIGPVTTIKTDQNRVDKIGCHTGSYAALHVPAPRGRLAFTK